VELAKLKKKRQTVTNFNLEKIHEEIYHKITSALIYTVAVRVSLNYLKDSSVGF